MVICISTGIYIRVSTDEQANNGYSIRAQEEKLKCYASIKEWEVHDVYIDEGISGKNITDREQLIRLIDDIKNGFVDNVLVYKIDRLTRSTKDLIDLIELFNKYNCSFNSLNESIDTKSSTGRMFIKIIGIFAEFERENIVERVKLGLERKVKEGYTIASRNISYGYIKRKGEKIQTVESEEAKTVNKIYDLFISGSTYTDIAKYLNNNNIVTKKGNKWSYKTIKLVLKNPNYIGNVRYGINTNHYFESLGKHSSIVSSDKYNLVQEIMKHYKKSDSLFSKVLFCTCGKVMHSKKTFYISIKKKKVAYINYFCSCKNKISEKKIEKELINHLNSPCYLSLSNHKKREYIDKKINKIIVQSGTIKEISYLL